MEATEKSGTATVNQATTTPSMVLDGRCITRTLQRIKMSDDALEKARKQAEALLADVLTAYASEIQPGEVGEGGSARASEFQVQGYCPTGLLYGRIQSGKTVAMITFAALAIDNGFRIIVVFTSNFVDLVKQTADRFSGLGRAIVGASTDREAWERDRAHMAKHVGERGVVIVCAKDSRHLESVNELLIKIGAANYPALILDDEADQASLDTNVRRRSRAKGPDEVLPTKIHDRIKDIRKTLRHHVFVQVTATPYALLLQNVTSPLRPRFTRVLEPGDGYTGGESFFLLEHIGADECLAEPKPPLVFVDEAESETIAQGPDTAPSGLQRAIAFFLVASAAQGIADPDVLEHSQNFLCHTSHKKAEHDKLYDLIANDLSAFEDKLEPLEGLPKFLMSWAYGELKKTSQDVPPLAAIVDDIVDRLPRRRIRIVNSEGKSTGEVRGAPNFIIGGNIVGRGLTIPNLLVTYYLRKPKVSQMDTMLQHARMFGYRQALMAYTRAFLPRSLAVRFNGIHEAENELRDLLRDSDSIEAVPVQVIGELRPTRYGVLDTGSVVTIPSGKHLYPKEPDFERSTKKVAKLLKAIFGSEFSEGVSRKEPVHATVTQLCELLDAFGVSDWDAKAIKAIIKSMLTDGARGYVQYRTMRRLPKRPELLTGALNGEELKTARARETPTFFILKQSHPAEVWNNHLFFYPTLVFPGSMPAQMYNNSEVAAV